MIEIGLVGPGRLGRTIAAALPTDDYHLGPIVSSNLVSARKAVRELRRGHASGSLSALAACDAVLLTVPEALLPGIARELLNQINLANKVVIYATGENDRATHLALRDEGAHPVNLFPLTILNRPAEDLAGVCCALAGSPVGLRFARRLAAACGAVPAVVDTESVPRIAAATALLVEPLTALAHICGGILGSSGLSRRRTADVLMSLTRTAIEDHVRGAKGGRADPTPAAAHADLRKRLGALRDREAKAGRETLENISTYAAKAGL